MISIVRTLDFYVTRILTEPTVEVLLVVFVASKYLLARAALFVKVSEYISAESNPLYPSQFKTAQFFVVVVSVVLLWFGLVFVVLHLHHIGSICCPVTFAFIPRTSFLGL